MAGVRSLLDSESVPHKKCLGELGSTTEPPDVAPLSDGALGGAFHFVMNEARGVNSA